jgi:hypothetical protein
MAKVFDYMLNDDLDLQISRGGFVVGESTLQHQKNLLLAVHGEYKQNPLIGVGMINFLDTDSDIQEFKQAVQNEFENDGMTILSMEVQDFTRANIEADYKESDETIQSNRS